MITPERKKAIIDCLEKGICDGVAVLTNTEIMELP